MYLLIGDLDDPWCLRVRAELEQSGHQARITDNPLTSLNYLTFRLEDQQSESHLTWEENPSTEATISGVLVCRMARIDLTDWQAKDLFYMHSETQAALLAWLWSLDCPVINRYPSATWYRPQIPLLAWQRLLHHCGLPTIEMLVTNVCEEAYAFRQRLADEGAAAAAYLPLTCNVSYLVSSDHDWEMIAAMQRYAPVCLTYAPGAVRSACVIGGEVVWDDTPGPELTPLEPALHRFAAAAGLAFVEVSLSQIQGRSCVIAIEHHPDVSHFKPSTMRRITAELIRALTISTVRRR